MITCTFVGTAQYDLDLNIKLQVAVEKVISKGNSINFLFYRITEEYYHLCFIAVLKAKHRFPRKNITMTLFTKQGEQEDYKPWMKLREPPKWAFDKIIPLLMGTEDKKPLHSPWRKIERELVRQSNFIIACCYPELRDSEYELFRYAKHQRHVCVLNLINNETADFISDTIKILPSDERSIVEKINEGCTYTSLARAAGISVGAIQTKDNRGRKRLRYGTRNRLKEAQIIQGPTVHGTCSVILPGGFTSESKEIKTKFLQTTNFLANCIGVSTFMIEKSNCPSQCMSGLFYTGKLDLIVVTHYSEQAGMNWDDIQKRYVPPFTKVLNIDTAVKPLWAKYLRSITAMLERSEYVICNLSETSPMDERIQRRIAKQKGITVIDLGKAPCNAEPQALISQGKI